MPKIKDYSLYLVISEEYAQSKTTLKIAEDAISGGVDIIQMREKNKNKRELIDLGHSLSGLCKDNNVTFIVNDDPLIAREINADGVHLGQEDIKRYSLQETRDILGQDKIIGISTHSLEQFQEANNKDVNYIAFGPIFRTQTKDYFIGTKDIKRALEITRKPVVFIGGINLLNVDEILSLGVKNIALIRDIVQAKDVKFQAQNFKQKLISRNTNITIKINGKEEKIERNIKLEDLISKRNLCCDRIIIEHNYQIVHREEWPEISLGENDSLEIVSFVGGG